jgi:hypothetical protein
MNTDGHGWGKNPKSEIRNKFKLIRNEKNRASENSQLSTLNYQLSADGSQLSILSSQLAGSTANLREKAFLRKDGGKKITLTTFL